MSSMSTTRCPYCGRELAPLSVGFAGQTYVVGAEECGCPGAVAERQAELAAKALEESNAILARRRAAGIPERFILCEGADPSDMELIAEGTGLYIHGPNGVGKTHRACMIAADCLKSGMAACFIQSARLRGSVFDGKRDSELFDRWASYGLLVIDDLGNERGDAIWADVLYRVIDERYAEMKPVVITSNYSRSSLASRLKESAGEELARAVASRLAGMTEAIAMQGADRRRL